MEDLIQIIREKAKDVYDKLKHGHSEYVYHNAILHALRKHGLLCESEVIVPIMYDDYYCGFFRCDIIVEKKIILELKAINKTTFLSSDSEIIQVNNYRRHTGIDTGILINFPKNGGPLIMVPVN